MAHDNSKSLLSPPSTSYRTFDNFLTKLGISDDIPPRIDRKFLNKSYSGATGSKLLNASRFFKLVKGEDDEVTAELEQLVRDKGARKQLLRQMLYSHYTCVLTEISDLSSAQYEELEQAFKHCFKVDDETCLEALSFFIHMAQEAGIPLSQNIQATTNPPSNRVPFKSTTKKAQQSNVRSIKDLATTPQFERLGSPSLHVGGSTGHTKTITLRKRETLTLTYTGDILTMDREDRAFFFHLIDEMQDYAQTIFNSNKSDGNAESKEMEDEL